MFNELHPKVYLALRHRAGHTQVQWAALLHVSKDTVIRWEKGKIQPKYDKLAEMMKHALVSRDQLTEIYCEALSDINDKRVAIVEGQDHYRPTTALAESHEVSAKHGHELSPETMAELDESMSHTKFMSVIMDNAVAMLRRRVRAALREVAGKKLEREGSGA